MATAYAKDNPPDNSEKQGGGLACFIVVEGGEDGKGPSCDEVCAAKDAVCVGIENWAPASCSQTIEKSAQCRCCRAVR